MSSNIQTSGDPHNRAMVDQTDDGLQSLMNSLLSPIPQFPIQGYSSNLWPNFQAWPNVAMAANSNMSTFQPPFHGGLGTDFPPFYNGGMINADGMAASHEQHNNDAIEDNVG